MSDFMRPIPFGSLMKWCRDEYAKSKSIFGISDVHFYRGKADKTYTTVFGDVLASPVGPAAGPHSQLAQNIIASYLCGARFIELKTVQKMDGEEIRQAVKKPCIWAEDEAYNCEWSTELTVQEAFDEYVKAYVAIKVLAKELGISDGNDFAYNMSVGYDLEGVQLPKIDKYIEGMKDASQTPVFQEALAWLKDNLDSFEKVSLADVEAISPKISHSITLSTLHGAKPSEIESIAAYLITKKGLNTFVKCNPTLLGYEFARSTLDRMGYDYMAFTDHHFKEDLQFADAVAMFERLLPLAEGLGLRFGVKLTNTFPVLVDRKQLPADEMYMSGRSLMALALNLGAKLAAHFGSRLPMAFSGGADAENVAEILATGVAPITMATTLLKPGGYARFKQIAEASEKEARVYRGIDAEALQALGEKVIVDTRNQKRFREKVRSRKTHSLLPLTDCYKAPCKDGGCPINQQIPEYLSLVEQGRYREAIEVISEDNTSASVLGVLCSQPCRNKCTRLDYEQSLEMRDIKLIAADEAQEAFIEAIQPAPIEVQKKVAIIGAGPAGMAAAVFLRRNGVEVDVFEKRDKAYGIVRYIIPGFRISEAHMDRDYRAAVAEGVNFHFGCDPNYDLEALKKDYGYVILATGACAPCASPVQEGGEAIHDAIDFLWEAKMGQGAPVKGRVAVVGAGDVAMDCARVALRTPGVEHVSIVYRRTEAYMPASQDEVNLARKEGIEILELTAPLSYKDGVLHCETMKLGGYEASGRKACVGTGAFVDLAYDHVIAATGARVDQADYEKNGLAFDERRRLRLSSSYESSVENVYVIGDGRVGPSTIVQAIADAKLAASSILRKEGRSLDFARREVPHSRQEIEARRGILEAAKEGACEGARCLSCDQICEVCTEVCPNRANVAIPVPGFANSKQIVHLDGMCNECGNCGTFCPHSGRPYKDKLTIFWTKEDFEESDQSGFLKLGEKRYLFRNEQKEVLEVASGDKRIEAPIQAILSVLEEQYPEYMEV